MKCILKVKIDYEKGVQDVVELIKDEIMEIKRNLNSDFDFDGNINKIEIQELI